MMFIGGVPTLLPTPWGNLEIADPFVLWSGLIPANGIAEFMLNLPNDPGLSGLVILGQGLVFPQLTPRTQVLLR
jgi:hypothetical protein